MPYIRLRTAEPPRPVSIKILIVLTLSLLSLRQRLFDECVRRVNRNTSLVDRRSTEQHGAAPRGARIQYNSAPHVGHALGMPPPSLAVQFRSQYLILLYWLSW